MTEDRDGWLQDVTATLESDGWKLWLRPRLEAELAKCRRQLEKQRHSDLGEVAGLQAQIRLLREILEDPKAFCKPPTPAEGRRRGTG